jgi:hypothetical protein
MLPDRTFGIELEAHMPAGKTHGQLAEAIRRAHVSVYCETYNHRTQAHWKVTTDASLCHNRREGVEVVSPILRGEAGIQEARRVAAVMAAFGCTISVRCGFHVHVGAGDLDLNQLRNVATSFVQAESAFDAIVTPSRRRDLNQYILSNRTAFGGSYDNGSVNNAIDAFARATTRDQLIGIVSAANGYGTRYRKLNMTAMSRYGTVEFRQHSGTVDADKVENWVRVCVAFVERSKTSKPRKRPSMKPHEATKELAALLKFLRADEAVRKFYQKRRRDLSPRRLARLVVQPAE